MSMDGFLRHEKNAREAEFESTVTLDGYRLLAKIGEGGEGEVFEATRESDGKTVAFKRFNPRSQARLDGQLEREIENLKKLKRRRVSGVAHWIADGWAEGRAYLVTELIRGETFGRWGNLSLPPGSPEEIQRRVKVLAAVAATLSQIHEAGFVHRDIKPSNIVIRTVATGGAEPVLVDFGLAKAIAPGQTLTQDDDGPLGTPQFLPPEAFRSTGRMDGRKGDIYALGITLYKALTGQYPFSSGRGTRISEQVLRFHHLSIVELNPTIPRPLKIIVEKAMAEYPKDRYATAKDLALDLHRFLADKPIAARPLPRWRRSINAARRHPWKAAACFLGALFLMGSMGFLVFRSRYQSARLEQMARADRLASASLRTLEDICFDAYEALRKIPHGDGIRRQLLATVERNLVTLAKEQGTPSPRLHRLEFLQALLRGEWEFDAGNKKLAAASTRRALEINERLSLSRDNPVLTRDRIIALNQLADILMALSRSREALAVVAEAESLEGAANVPLRAEIARTRFFAAQQAGRIRESGEAIREAARLTKDEHAHPQDASWDRLRATVYRDLGSFLLDHGTLPKTHEAFAVARASFDHSLTPGRSVQDALLDAMIAFGQAQISLREGRTAEATTSLMKIDDRLAGLTPRGALDPIITKKRIAVLGEACRALRRDGRTKESFDVRVRRLRLLRRLHEADGTDVTVSRIFAKELVQHAEDLIEQNKKPKAVAALTQAVESVLELAERPQGLPVDSRLLVDAFGRMLVIGGYPSDPKKTRTIVETLVGAPKTPARRSHAALLGAAANELVVSGNLQAAAGFLDEAARIWDTIPPTTDDSGWRRLRMRSLALMYQVVSGAGQTARAKELGRRIAGLCQWRPQEETLWDLEPLTETLNLASKIAAMQDDMERAWRLSGEAQHYADERLRWNDRDVEAWRDGILNLHLRWTLARLLENEKATDTTRTQLRELLRRAAQRFSAEELGEDVRKVREQVLAE